MSEHMHDHDSCATTCSFIHTNTRTGVIQFGNLIHRRVPTNAELRSGPSTRRGVHVALRGRCVECYDRAPIPASGRGRKEFMSDGKRIPCVFYACDVCHKHLCRDCFHHVYDHHRQGRSFDTVTLR